MLPTTPEFSKATPTENIRTPPTSSQHGPHDYAASPSTPRSEEDGGMQDSGSEWSLSTSSSPSDYDAWVGPGNAIASQEPINAFMQQQGKREGHPLKDLDIGSPLLECPSEILLQMLSHLGATDLLTVKLLSRRFYSLVNSPHAWISAFAKYFPGPSTVKPAKSQKPWIAHDEPLATDKRSFTRLAAVPSWTGEYLLRTKLLRCLMRGRPSVPFATSNQGKPHKGYATRSYNSRLGTVTHMDANFGPVLDKRLPQFIHGCDLTGAVSMSDRRGELKGWGGWGIMQNGSIFRSFADEYPGSEAYGLGPGDIVGVPNVMDVSTQHGMLYGEGVPGGHVFFMPANDQRATILRDLEPLSDPGLGVPFVSTMHSVCSVWISKSSAVPKISNGLVGILCGSSSGCISSYSVGTPERGWLERNERLVKGELTARWMLSPGVPIVKIVVDDNYTAKRHQQGRIWAVALNALGEVFYMTSFPTLTIQQSGEISSWQKGHTAPWRLVASSQRMHKPFTNVERESPPYYSEVVFRGTMSSKRGTTNETEDLQSWCSKSPIEIRSAFEGWDMQRSLEVDFSGDDGNGGGQNLIVVDRGTNGEDTRNASIRRYTSYGLVEDLSASTATLTLESLVVNAPAGWRTSNLDFGRSKNYHVTAVAMDYSAYALTTSDEDIALKHIRGSEGQAARPAIASSDDDQFSPFKSPGHRARFFGVGTASGQVLLWNVRGTVSQSSSVTNDLMPVRVIQTDSPEVSALALTALYLVHGGSEGLVQAWDPLASTLSPIRTICSALSRRALVAAQQGANASPRSLSAVGAICLDTEASLLRGIVATRGNLRFWSYSSLITTKATQKSQKRKLHRGARGVNSSPGVGLLGGRRVDLRGVINQELNSRGLDEQERLAEEKEHRRVNGRFGMNLLGEDATEDELIAYAKLLSEEEAESNLQKAMEKKLARDASEIEVEAYMRSLSAEDYKRWKFASWEDRFEMPASGSTTMPPASPALRSIDHNTDDDADIAEAVKLSLREARGTSSLEALQPSSSKAAGDMAEAARHSLALQKHVEIERPSSIDSEDDIAQAIRLSLQDSDAASSPWTRASRRSSAFDDDEFPALSSSPRSTPSSSSGGWGKGKKRVW